MVKVLAREELKVPSFWSIPENSNSKFSETVVKEFTQKQLQNPSFSSFSEH